MDTADQDLRARVVSIEQWIMERKIDTARHDEKWKHLEETLATKFDHINEKFTETNEGLRKLGENQNRVFWVVVIAIIGGIVQFIFRGGMSPI